jgi:hypothetical protein
MVRSDKIFLRFLIGFFVLLVTVGASIWLYNDMERLWNDEMTWQNPVLKFPVEARNIKATVTRNKEDKKISYRLDYCALYKVSVTESSSDFYCSLLPVSYLQKYGINPAEDKIAIYKLEPDVLFKLSIEKDPEPTSYLGTQILSSSSYNLNTDEIIPVSVNFDFEYSYPEKSVFLLVQHYYNYFTGKPNYFNAKLISWNVDEIKPFDSFTNEEKNEFIKKWAKDTFFNLNVSLGIAQLDTKSGLGYVDGLIEKLAVEKSVCTTRGPCQQFGGNVTGNVITYLFILSYEDPDTFNSVMDTIFASYPPFIKESTKSEFDVISFPVCPIADLSTGRYESLRIKFFTRYIGSSPAQVIRNGESLHAVNINAESETFDFSLKHKFSRTVDVLCLERLNNKNQTLEEGKYNKFEAEVKVKDFYSVVATRYSSLIKGTTPKLTDANGRFNPYSYANTEEWKQMFIKYVYEDTQFQPYKNNSIQRTVFALDFPEDLKTKKVEKDLNLTLLLLYHAYGL